MAQHTKYQQDIISRYYDNLNTIMLDKLGELVTEIYLADSVAKKERLWLRVEKAMANLKVPDVIRQHILARRDVEVLAKNLKDWLTKSRKK